MKQTSAIERLLSLPAIFRGSDLTVRFQWKSKTASQYLYLWKCRGLVESLGGHSDVFANLLVDRQPNWEKALSTWFALVLKGITRRHKEGLRVLSPAWALADLLRESPWGTFGLDPDDIEWDEVSKRDEKQWKAACKAFGLPETLMSFGQ